MKLKENISGLSRVSNISYEKYLKSALDLISPHLSIRTYKLGSNKNYPCFEKGKDIRVKIFWKNEEKYEFLVEKLFFYQNNNNKEDRAYMRNWADIKIQMLKDAVVVAKKNV
jgi:hypothetical protein